MKFQLLHNLVMHLQSKLDIRGHKIFTIQHKSHMKLQKYRLSDHLSYLIPTSIRYLPTRQWYHKSSTDPVKTPANIHWRIQQETPSQSSYRYQLFHTVKPVQEIKWNRSMLQRREILRCPDGYIDLRLRDFHICVSIITALPTMNVLSQWSTASKVGLWNSILRKSSANSLSNVCW